MKFSIRIVFSLVVLIGVISILPYGWGYWLQYQQQVFFQSLPYPLVATLKNQQRGWLYSQQQAILYWNNASKPLWQINQRFQHGFWHSHIHSEITYLPEPQTLQAITQISPLGQQTTLTLPQWIGQKKPGLGQLAKVDLTWTTTVQNRHQVVVAIEQLQWGSHQLKTLAFQAEWHNHHFTADFQLQQWQHPAIQASHLQGKTTGILQSEGGVFDHHLQAQFDQLFPTPSQLDGQWQQQFLSLTELQRYLVAYPALTKIPEFINGQLALHLKTNQGDLQLQAHKPYNPPLTAQSDFKLTAQLAKTLWADWQTKSQHPVTQGLHYLMSRQYLLEHPQEYQLHAHIAQGYLNINQQPILAIAD